MKAVVYHGPPDVSVKEVPDAKIERPTDVLVRMTSTNICGSDLHRYEGRIFGHENLGQGHEHPSMAMNNLMKSVRFTGGIGVVGVYIPQDQGSPDPMYKQGEIAFDMGLFWFKGQHIATGQATSRPTTVTCATSSMRVRPIHPGSCRTTCPWTRH